MKNLFHYTSLSMHTDTYLYLPNTTFILSPSSTCDMCTSDCMFKMGVETAEAAETVKTVETTCMHGMQR
jgi:hypothetical protein